MLVAWAGVVERVEEPRVPNGEEATNATRTIGTMAERDERFRPGMVVTLPLRLEWSGPARSHDLSDPRELCHVYALVLREGTATDVRRYIDPDVLLSIWDAITLPANIRRPWVDWFRGTRGIELDPRPELRGLPVR